MELIIFIVAIALAYHYMVRKPKQRKLDAELQEAEYMDISQKESAKGHCKMPLDLQVLFSGLPKQNNVKFRRLLFRQSKMITIILST